MARGLGRDLQPALGPPAPAGWTSADAAGLPILPGLARYDEVARGAIDHALRFTAPCTAPAYVYPARHEASTCSGLDLPPMGLRVRLKASVNISGLPYQARVVAQALKTLRDDPRRQRLALVHLRRAEPALERRRAASARPADGPRLRGRRHELAAAPRAAEPALGPRGREIRARCGCSAWALAITERDLELLVVPRRAPPRPAAHVAGAARDLGGGREQRGCARSRRAGFAAPAGDPRRQPRCHQITRTGLAAIGSRLPLAAAPTCACYRHDVGVAWLWLAARGGHFGPLREMISERTDALARRRAPTGLAEPFGVRLGGVGPAGEPRLHYPDLLLRTRTGHRVALELELTGKGRARRETILAGYARRPADRRGPVPRRAARRVGARDRGRRRAGSGISSLVHVQRVRVGPEIAAGRGQRRAPSRAPGEPAPTRPSGGRPVTAASDAPRRARAPAPYWLLPAVRLRRCCCSPALAGGRRSAGAPARALRRGAVAARGVGRAGARGARRRARPAAERRRSCSASTAAGGR